MSTNTPAVVESYKWAAERRHRSRSGIFTPAYASFDGSNALDLHELLNISEEGFSAQILSETPVNQTIQFRLILSEGHGSIAAQGRVAWNHHGRLGIQLEPLDLEPRRQLEAWLFLNAMRAPSEEHPAAAEEKTASAQPEQRDGVAEQASLLNALDSIRREVLSLSLHPQAAVQLIADRAFTLTEATGCAVAVREVDAMVCQGRAGEDAPPIGASFHTGSGFSGECVQRKSPLRCDDSEIDSLVDRESCRALGIRSLLAVPISSGESVVGLIEVFSPVANAFGELHEKILVELAEYVSPSVASMVPADVSAMQDSADQPEKWYSRFPLKRSHVIVGMTAFALLAGVLGYLAAPWLQKSVSKSPEPRAISTETPTVSPKPVSRTSATQATTIDQLRQLAENGDPAAQFGLGAHYAIGDGVKLDNAEAARWFIKAAEQGHVIAQDTMGAYYWAGRGVPKNLRKAYFWSLLGRAGNNETSKYRIVALNALLSREEIEDARQDAERWIRERTLAAKSSSKQ
jgi:TPR repeat protein